MKVAERIRERLALTAAADDSPSTTANLGVTSVPEGTDLWAAVREAGRNRVRAAVTP